MRQPRHRLRRQQLYCDIWARPVVDVAADLGISNVALKKICKKHQIPTPGRGYWARKNAGYLVQKANLPVLDDPALDTILIFGLAERDASLELEMTPQVQIEENPPANEITVHKTKPREPIAPISKRQEVTEARDLDVLKISTSGLLLGGAIDYAAADHAVKLANEKTERVRRERERIQEQCRQEVDAARRLFLDQRMKECERAAQLDSFVTVLESRTSQARPSDDQQLARFIAWIRTEITSLHAACSPNNVQKELVERSLFPG